MPPAGPVERSKSTTCRTCAHRRHGYGLRNIETAALAYNGTVSVSADDRWFSLRVLFPQQETETASASA